MGLQTSYDKTNAKNPTSLLFNITSASCSMCSDPVCLQSLPSTDEVYVSNITDVDVMWQFHFNDSVAKAHRGQSNDLWQWIVAVMLPWSGYPLQLRAHFNCYDQFGISVNAFKLRVQFLQHASVIKLKHTVETRRAFKDLCSLPGSFTGTNELI